MVYNSNVKLFSVRRCVCVCVFCFVLIFFLSLFSTKRGTIKLLDSVLVMPEIREPWLF